jgi:AraC family transcriptional regulator
LTKRFVYLRPLRVIYVRSVGAYPTSSSQSWERMLAWLDEAGLRRTLVCGYGLARDDPHLVAPDKCRYDACIEMPVMLPVPLPTDFGVQRLPGGAYKRQRHVGSYRTIREALYRVRGELPLSDGLAVDAQRPLVAIYLDDPMECPEERLRADLCVPVISQEQSVAAHRVA